VRNVRRGQSGQAAVEVALMAPWVFFLFIGIFDLGFYCYSAVCSQNAARAVAIAYASGGASSSCGAALGELNMLPNITLSLPCTGSISSANPLVVSATELNGGVCPDHTLLSSAELAVPFWCVESAVTYQTVQLLPIPGFLTGQMTLTRTAWMRLIQ